MRRWTQRTRLRGTGKSKLPKAMGSERLTSPAATFLLALTLAACSTTPTVREVTVTKEVPVPYAAPCPKPADIPAQPKRVAVEHPVMPADPTVQARILAAKVLEWIGYGEAASGVMTACSRP